MANLDSILQKSRTKARTQRRAEVRTQGSLPARLRVMSVGALVVSLPPSYCRGNLIGTDTVRLKLYATRPLREGGVLMSIRLQYVGASGKGNVRSDRIGGLV